MLPGDGVVSGVLGDGVVSGWLGDGVRLGEDDGEGARLDEGSGVLLSDGRPEPGGLSGRVTPGENRGPVPAPGEAGAVGTGDDPAGVAGPGELAG